MLKYKSDFCFYNLYMIARSGLQNVSDCQCHALSETSSLVFEKQTPCDWLSSLSANQRGGINPSVFWLVYILTNQLQSVCFSKTRLDVSYQAWYIFWALLHSMSYRQGKTQHFSCLEVQVNYAALLEFTSNSQCDLTYAEKSSLKPIKLSQFQKLRKWLNV